MMRTEKHVPPRLSPSLKLMILKTKRNAAYVILVLLTYTVGYLSHDSSRTPTPSSLHILQHTINTTELQPFRVTTQCTDPLPPEMVHPMLVGWLFDKAFPYENFPPPHVAEKLRRTPQMIGWGSNGAVFENLIRHVRPRIIIEVGTFHGASAIHMAELTQRLGLETQILCIDDFRGWPGFRDTMSEIPMQNGDVFLYYEFLQNVIAFNHTKTILPLPFNSGAALIALCDWGVFGDLIEIDAGHDFLSAWIDINRGFRILRPGGVIFGHDYFNVMDNRGVKRAVDLFAKVNNLKVDVDDQHWVIYT